MNKLHYLLVLLVLQCGLIVWLYTYDSSDPVASQAEQSLLAVEADKLVKIAITDEHKRSVLLEKTAKGWVLPDYHGLDVDRGLLEQLLDKLTSLQAKWPVATTAGAAERFNVSAQHFKRYVKLTDIDGMLHELYLGDSPEPRKRYARNASSASIYAIELGLHLVPGEAQTWFDKRLLKIKAPMQQIKGADFAVSKQGEQWLLDDLQENEKMDQTRLNGFVNVLSYPQVKAVLGDEKVAALKDQKPVAHYDVRTESGDVAYDIYRQGDEVVLKSSQSELYFIVPVYVTESLLSIKRNTLVNKIVEQTLPDAGSATP